MFEAQTIFGTLVLSGWKGSLAGFMFISFAIVGGFVTCGWIIVWVGSSFMWIIKRIKKIKHYWEYKKENAQ